MTRRRFARLAALSTAAALAGCHGAGRGAGATPVPFGRATFSVNWPAPSRLIPAASNSIVIQVKKGATVLQQKVLTRPAGGGVASVEFDQLPIGVLTAVATAYPTAGGTGVAQATASASVTIQPGQTTAFRLTMASTIDRLSASPSGTVTVAKGKTVPLTAAALDTAGKIVLTGALKWSSSNPGVATVDGAGVVTGVGVGSATITVQEMESGKTLPVPVETVNPTGPGAVCYQLNPEHNGATTFGQPLSFPTVAAWSVDLGRKVGYPLIADGRAFVLTDDPFAAGIHLRALSLSTGAPLWGPILIPAGIHIGGFAYESGRVFATSVDGQVYAFEAATGSPLWSATLPDQRRIGTPPVARDGAVYVMGAGIGASLYAYDAATGAPRWDVPIEGGNSLPAVTGDGVFVSVPCQTYRLSPASGATLWRDSGACSGGGGNVPVYAGGLLCARDGVDFFKGVVLNAATGAHTGVTFPSAYTPQVSGGTAVQLDRNGVLTALNLTSGASLWSATDPNALVLPPIAVDDFLFTATFSGELQARNRATGDVAWVGTTDRGVFFQDSVATVQPGIAAAEGYVLLPTDTALTAWKFAGP